MQNRRQQAEWEQQALELVRRFQVEQAVSLYRVVLAETKDELTAGCWTTGSRRSRTDRTW